MYESSVDKIKDISHLAHIDRHRVYVLWPIDMYMVEATDDLRRREMREKAAKIQLGNCKQHSSSVPCCTQRPIIIITYTYREIMNGENG